MLSKLYAVLVVGKEKAVAVSIVGLVGMYAVKCGLTLTPRLQDLLISIISAVLLHQTVYWTQNR